MTRPVHECEITACSGCGQEFSKAAGARERLCYGCWCKSHPCQVNEDTGTGEISQPERE